MEPLLVKIAFTPNGMNPAATGSIFQEELVSIVTLPLILGATPLAELLPGTTVLFSPINLIKPVPALLNAPPVQFVPLIVTVFPVAAVSEPPDIPRLLIRTLAPLLTNTASTIVKEVVCCRPSGLKPCDELMTALLDKEIVPT